MIGRRISFSLQQLERGNIKTPHGIPLQWKYVNDGHTLEALANSLSPSCTTAPGSDRKSRMISLKSAFRGIDLSLELGSKKGDYLLRLQEQYLQCFLTPKLMPQTSVNGVSFGRRCRVDCSTGTNLREDECRFLVFKLSTRGCNIANVLKSRAEDFPL